MSDHPDLTAPGPERRFSLYDRLLSGERVDDDCACDLRALARVFDIDADPGIPLARIWRQVRSVLAEQEGRGGLENALGC